MVEDRGTDGRFTPEHTDEDVLAAVRAHEPAATSEVGDELGMTRQGADRRLRRLRDEGRVNSKKIGASLVWFAPRVDTNAGGRETTVGRESGGTVAESAPSETGAPTTPDTTEADTDSVTARDDELVGAVRAFLADQPPRTSHGTDAVLDVFQLLRERGTMKTGALKDALHETYADRYGSKRAMWESVSRYLDDVPGVEKGGYGEWAYAGDEATRAAVDGTTAGASDE
jgi:DNA-binding Lrp family transcriptional regulator